MSSRVILVEDSSADALMLREALADVGSRVKLHRITRGDQVLEAVVRERPSLVVLDLALPGLAGFDVLRLLRAHDEVGAVPVVVLTGSPNSSDERRCRELGADGFFVKPATPDGYDELGRALVDGFLAPRAAG